jgi:hypothetical protein
VEAIEESPWYQWFRERFNQFFRRGRRVIHPQNSQDRSIYFSDSISQKSPSSIYRLADREEEIRRNEEEALSHLRLIKGGQDTVKLARIRIDQLQSKIHSVEDAHERMMVYRELGALYESAGEHRKAKAAYKMADKKHS